MDFPSITEGDELIIRDEISNGSYVSVMPLEPGKIGMFKVDAANVGTIWNRKDYLILKTNEGSECLPIGCDPLLGISSLKQHIAVTEDSVECCVLGCENKVKRQQGHYRHSLEFLCPLHRISVSPSTFQYPSETHNLLNRSDDELAILGKIKRSKRESRIARERSEDAVTWNVFRSLQQNDFLARWLSLQTGREENVEDVIYWSHSLANDCQWDKLNEAREAFGEKINRGSEPDMAVLTDKTVFFIESKLDATNNTSGTGKDLDKRLAYTHYTKGSRIEWFNKVFSSDYAAIVKAQRYELMRFWLLGSWLAKEIDRDFCLLLLLREGAESEIHNDFSRCIKSSEQNRFMRVNWEDICQFVGKQPNPDKELLTYFKNKTLGYDADGNLRKAFTA